MADNHESCQISGAIKGTSYAKLYVELGWEPLSSRKKLHLLSHFYEIVKSLFIHHLSELLPKPFSLGAPHKIALERWFSIPSIPRAVCGYRSRVSMASDSYIRPLPYHDNSSSLFGFTNSPFFASLPPPGSDEPALYHELPSPDRLGLSLSYRI